MYKNRVEAGQILAESLTKYQGQTGLVLGVPRGGVIVAQAICERLGWPMEVIIPRKVPAPYNPEVAIGAVTEDGTVIMDDKLLQVIDIEESTIEKQVELALKEVQERVLRYRGNRRVASMSDKLVVVVDDGIATGFTLKAALHSLQGKASRVVLAIPVAPNDSLKQFDGLADEIICPLKPVDFYGVGQFYLDFPQNNEEEVVAILNTYSQP